MCPSLLTALALAVGAPAPKDDPKKDPPSMVGEWVSESGAVGGDDRDIYPGRLTLQFTAAGRVRIREGTKELDPSNYRTDASKSPAEIDIIPLPGQKEPVLTGIYKFDGDVLTVCLSRGGKRPSKFGSPAGSDVILMTLKRAKPKD